MIQLQTYPGIIPENILKIMIASNTKRKIDYLRISVTDRCNFRCRYCMPPGGVAKLEHKDILSFEEIVAVVKTAANLGFSRVRVTGGEPLIRKGLPNLIHELAQIQQLKDLSLTTNGFFLKDLAGPLRETGLKRINVSLDALDPSIFSWITRGGELAPVLEGLAETVRVGFPPPRLNAVILKGINEDQILPLVKYARETKSILRFIEMMPMSPGNMPGDFFPGPQIQAIIESRYPLVQAQSIPGGGPARYLNGPDFTVGFISPMTGDICSNCNRMRLTSDGRLRPCLASEDEFDLKSALRENGDLEEVFQQALDAKPPHHCFAAPNREGGRLMSAIGG